MIPQEKIASVALDKLEAALKAVNDFSAYTSRDVISQAKTDLSISIEMLRLIARPSVKLSAFDRVVITDDQIIAAPALPPDGA